MTPASAEAMCRPLASPYPHRGQGAAAAPYRDAAAKARELDTAAGDDALDLLDQLQAACSPAPTGPAPGSGCGPARAGPGRPGQRHGAVKALLDPLASGLPAGDTIGRTVPSKELAAAM